MSRCPFTTIFSDACLGAVALAAAPFLETVL